MRVLTVVGARPQFVKAAAVSRVLRRDHDEVLVHTGQHHDDTLSGAQFRDLALPVPDVELHAGSGPPGPRMTAMIRGLRMALRDASPDWVVVYGDTDSTVAGALAARLEGVRLAHVEAGLRSGRLSMPEEGNRIVADHIADLLLCPVPRAAATLRAEHARGRIETPGDVMLDVLVAAEPALRARDEAARLGVAHGGYVVATLHRPSNVDDLDRLRALFDGLAAVGAPVLFPCHPRTGVSLATLFPDGAPAAVRLLDPLPHGALLSLVATARAVVTDSGGLQKEAAFLGVPCVTVRTETEWPETTASGWNRLVPDDVRTLSTALTAAVCGATAPAAPFDRAPFGGGSAAERVAAILAQ